MMNKKTILVAALAVTTTFSSCGLNNAVKGGGIGAAAGALLGAGIGKVTGNTGLGAAIGGVVGGAAGTLIGVKMDKQKKELEESIKNAKIESINNGQAIKVTFDSGLLFSTGSATLSSASRDALQAFSESSNRNALTQIKIVGHTDNTGSDRVNQPLSVNRAKSVYNYLAKLGIASSRMSYSGVGSTEPVASNDTVAGRKDNRRVEVYILPSEEMVKAAENGTLK